jgi:hypothetical protein
MGPLEGFACPLWVISDIRSVKQSMSAKGHKRTDAPQQCGQYFGSLEMHSAKNNFSAIRPGAAMSALPQ